MSGGTFAQGLIAHIGEDFTAAGVLDAYLLSGETYVPDFLTNPDLTVVDDGDILAGPVALTATSALGGHLLAGPTTFPDVGPLAEHIRAVLVVWDGGPLDTDRSLIAYVDRRADTRLIDVAAVGDDIVVTWSPLGVFNI